MRLWSRWRADVMRPDWPLARDERALLLSVPYAIVVLAQAADPGSGTELLLVGLAALPFIVRALWSPLPAELMAVGVVVPVTLAVGFDGALEGSFFLVVLLVLDVSWRVRSHTRTAAIVVLAALGPVAVAEHLAPVSGIEWPIWSIAILFTVMLGRALQRQRRLIEDLEVARRALADRAVAEERRQIARELHDLAGHTLAAVVLHVTGARHVLRRDVTAADAALRDAETVGRDGLDEFRTAVAALRTDDRGVGRPPADLADVPELIHSYRRAGLCIEAEIDTVTGIPRPIGTAVHRITREALANVARHAAGNRVELALGTDGDVVRLVVVDRGRPGHAPPNAGLHFGLIGMAERARSVGGELVAGPTRDGWRVEARLPLPAHHRAAH